MSRPLLMIPGPIEFEQSVLDAVARHGTSHVDPGFIQVFGDSIRMLRDVFQAEDGQPFIMSGSGTLAWDQAASNLIETGDKVLVINTGYFGDAIGECMSVYGGVVTHLNATPGSAPTPDELRQQLTAANYKVITITHVDTSTAVLTPLQAYMEVIRELSPASVVVVDAVCALAGEDIRMTEWDVDLVLTGSQKALGVPAGLAVSVVRPRALQVFENRKQPPSTYYLSWARWLPILKAYEEGRPSYFATPAVSHIFALHASLTILVGNGGIAARINEHRVVADAFKAGLAALGLSEVPLTAELKAHTLSAVRYPSGVTGATLLPKLKKHGIQCAGGLHKDIKAEYFRVGHMGPSTRTWAHVETAIQAIENALIECGHQCQTGAGVAAVRSNTEGLTFPNPAPTSADTATVAKAAPAAGAAAASGSSCESGKCCNGMHIVLGVAAIAAVAFLARRS